ncbi:MAG: hypothetical protein N4J56_001380 [Chroococcidiopsis sp. SAG 2025]|uniref:hypothetical protein n=1 Tax=Chroococcidiopsis sp. SAG 2025 TaxID=171389 RepID=UPI0029372AD6|nr:hypothetical protein [Chroococcidiopsis sp. SAG 2025]MDV2991726.1 hypothetical protein [Chroococcidiopsis sp. SAG 2025]
MGVSAYYQAIPEESRLFHRVQTEKQFSYLFDLLFPYSYGIFYILMWQHEDDGSLDEILDGVAESKEIFNSRSEVDLCFNQLCAELEQASRLYPGLEDRGIYLENIQSVFEERLVRELKSRQLDRLLPYVEKLLGGDRPFGLEPQNGLDLYIVPSSIVKEGVRIFREVEPETLFNPALAQLNEVIAPKEENALERFEWWRGFYLEAADKGEAVLIEFC